MGIDETFNILLGEGREWRGYAVSLQAVPDATRRGGAVVQLGILPPDAASISLSVLILRELTVFGSQRFEEDGRSSGSISPASVLGAGYQS